MLLKKTLTLGIIALGTTIASGQAAAKPHVLMISIDGMRPDYVIKADEHHLRLPVLRRFLAQGTYAEGVIGVLPTLTYPSHTTLITGVWPVEHGIISNTIFDPLGEHPGAWYWYFNAVKAETLYQAASKAHLKTAAISWPVTVGAPIDFLIAESPQSEETDTPEGPLVRPANLKETLGVTIPSPPPGADKSTKKDLRVIAWSVGIIRKYQPNFTLVHISALDHEQHLHGPFSDDADKAIETIDTQVGEIIAAELKVDPRAKIIIVSDHGFVPVQHSVSVNLVFAKEGLIKLKPGRIIKGVSPVKSWDAATWVGGGTVAVVLHNPNDKAMMARVAVVLEKMKNDPLYGIASILTHDEIVKGGGNPEAAFMIDFKPGYTADASYDGEIVKRGKISGTHGYLPAYPDLRSTFMADGYGIAKHRDVGIIDMRQIAPSIAEMLRIKLPEAKLKPIPYQP